MACLIPLGCVWIHLSHCKLMSRLLIHPLIFRETKRGGCMQGKLVGRRQVAIWLTSVNRSGHVPCEGPRSTEAA